MNYQIVRLLCYVDERTGLSGVVFVLQINRELDVIMVRNDSLGQPDVAVRSRRSGRSSRGGRHHGGCGRAKNRSIEGASHLKEDTKLGAWNE